MDELTEPVEEPREAGVFAAKTLLMMGVAAVRALIEASIVSLRSGSVCLVVICQLTKK